MRKLAITSVVLGAGLVLTGCGLGDLVDTAGNKESVEDYTVKEKITELRVKSESGDISITETDRADVQVVETVSWNGDNKPETRHETSGGLLTLDYSCPARIGFTVCSVDYKVEVPRGVTVMVNAGSGDVTLRELSGELSVETGAGDIQAVGLSSKNGRTKSGSGDVELKYASAPDALEIEVGAGNAVVRLPRDSYAVDAKIPAGDKRIEVVNDPSSPRKVSITTGAGDASVLAS